MIPPLISYVTFNNLEETEKNLGSILNTNEYFEMHIIDNQSTDGTWDYIKELKDKRIISKAQLEVNYGKVYATNLNLTRRRPEQYFITIDNNVCIETDDFIQRFLQVFEAFPEVGLLGVYDGQAKNMPKVQKKSKDKVSFLMLDNRHANIEYNYIPSYCMCLRPELLEVIGYLCEENCFGDIELSYRVNNYTDFKSGFVKDIKVNIPKSDNGIYVSKSDDLYKIEEFKKRYRWKFDETIKDMKNGTRPVYCASMLDSVSTSNHTYNKEWALENLRFFIENTNK